MKILWVKSDFLHPTTRGGQIRTLEMLRCLHRRHEVHYVAFRAPGETEGVARSSEYSTRAYPIDFQLPAKTSTKFYAQLLGGLLDSVPLAVSRFRSAAMRHTLAEVLSATRFDHVICDFLVPAVNLPSMQGVVLFQHNVETMIWRRRVEHARNPLERAYLKIQSGRMFRYEREICRTAGRVIAVSPLDSATMQKLFGLQQVPDVPTGVNLEYFHRPPECRPQADLVFVGSMDWMPNVDGILYFVHEILPLIRKQRPETTLAIVGRDPSSAILQLAERDPLISVTGTVPDVRPYLWGSTVSIVPLRIGGGTRLKIYEAMAARTATVSTRVGAEGIAAEHPVSIRLADEPAEFATECLALLEDANARGAVADSAWKMVDENYSWERVARQFEAILERP